MEQHDTFRQTHLPVCVYHEDCFANKMGKCICLSDNKFKRDCPFYKNNEDYKEELRRCMRHLRTKGRGKLIERYKLRTSARSDQFSEEE